jgi:hypothetical protein
VSGTLQIQEFRAYYEASVSITNAPANDTINWRIYPGTCATPGTTVVGNSNQAFTPLVTNASGAASLSRTMAGALVGSDVYNVRIMTGTNINTTIACGALQRQ